MELEMPRQARIDFPGAIHHVIARGNERRVIFKDDDDRTEFLERLEKAIEETGCECHAWVLMPNHFHLLIKTGDKPLSKLMGSLQTGYAIYFNAKYKRRGHLYQNRYKSILCQEDSFYMELLRYIHLNPIRAKILENITQLDKYPWTGHSTIMGKTKRKWQSINSVVMWFNKNKTKALLEYKEFIKQGMHQGYCDDYMGGGMKRSYGGWDNVKAIIQSQGNCRGDDRILGDGEFVEEILKEYGKEKERIKYKIKNWNIEKIAKEVLKILALDKKELRKKRSNNKISKAKEIIAYQSYEIFGINGVKVADYFGISRTAVGKLIKKGEQASSEMDVKLLC